MTYDISSLVLNLGRIRGVPGLGRLLGRFRLGGKLSGYLILAISGLCFATAGLLLVSIVDHRNWNKDLTFALFRVVFALAVVGVLTVRGGAGLVLLNRAASRLHMGDGSFWIRNVFSKAAQVPRAFPKSVGKTLWIITLATISLFLYALAVLAVIIGVVIQDLFGFLINLFILGIPFSIATTLKHRVNRLRSVPGEEVLKSDRRAPVVFLRSFADDALKTKRETSFNFTKPRVEDYVAVPNWAQGPVIAIGKPGEKLPLFGACREYCAHDRWQQRVLQLLERCGSAVMILGVTEGIGWEIGQIVERNYLPKTLFVIPPVKDQDAQQRIDVFRKQFDPASIWSAQDGLDPARTVLVGFLSNSTLFVIAARRRVALSYRVAFVAASVIRSTAATTRARQ